MNKLRKMIFSGVSGFTLLEVIVALALLTLITSFMFGAGTFGKRAWETASQLEDASGVNPVRDFLRRRISQAKFAKEIDGNDPGTIFFTGRTDQIAFVSEVNETLNRGGLYLTTLYLKNVIESDGHNQVLLIREILLRSDPTKHRVGTDAQEQVLIEGVKEIKLRYYGNQKRTQGEEQWSSNWDSPYRLPKLVSLDLTFQKQESYRRVWQELIIATKLARENN